MTRLLMVTVMLFSFFGCSTVGGSRTDGTFNDMFRSIPTGEELKCTAGSGGGGSSGTTCTSSYAFPCLEGWSPCPLQGGNKTCCKKN